MKGLNKVLSKKGGVVGIIIALVVGVYLVIKNLSRINPILQKINIFRTIFRWIKK